ncbi:GNAT family N-acetyltransferase [Litorimonas sp. RW-G-Af-16]|uniref:GNAT family N-acetyltransferase n=1 Tax=Litorimonas sp. RW-G-Af-16 TaxID=3241168 RepID=UPI00390CD2FF
MSEDTYSARILTQISDVSEAAWDAHLPETAHPFLSWRFLHACEASGSAMIETGWAPRHIWLEDSTGQAIGAAPLYAKTHSQGEYVFDHGWADALERAGIAYYPKLQGSIPFTPATGPRLLAKTKDAKIGLASAMVQACHEWDMSGVHLTFLEDDDRAVLNEIGFAAREDRQFHFINRDYGAFDHFLAALSSKKRKNIRRERREAQDGVVIKRLTGDDLKDEHWDIFYRCYLDTGQRKWGRPYLTREFFAYMQETMRDDIILVMAWIDDTPIAAALNFIGGAALYGRNWGALTHKPLLHFELCYYQAIEAGIELRLPKVEAGAQGEHKLARGYEPVATHSAHYLAHPGLRDAVSDYLSRERRAVEHEIKVLSKHTPFRKGDASD